ncbi:unnamed protein product, partial [Linum tenue]
MVRRHRHPPRGEDPNRYVVEYDQLYEDESGEKLLQETLDWIQLRPPPPPPEKKKVQFKFGDEVEAFHSDGWLPLQWVKGKWEPRFEQVQREKEVMKFTQGMQVEVTTDEDGFKGAWFAATIIEPSGEDEYLIEYKTLTNDDDTEFLREDIRACNIRPCPPEIIVVDGFKVMDEVDAYYNEGCCLPDINLQIVTHFEPEKKTPHNEARAWRQVEEGMK